MKLFLDDREIPIRQRDVVIARNAVNVFLETTKAGAQKAHSSSLYFTTLLMMYKKSTELLYELGVDNLGVVMKLLNGSGEQTGESADTVNRRGGA